MRMLKPTRKCCKYVLEMEASTVPNEADLHQYRSCGALFMYDSEKKEWRQFPKIEVWSSGKPKQAGIYHVLHRGVEKLAWWLDRKDMWVTPDGAEAIEGVRLFKKVNL